MYTARELSVIFEALNRQMRFLDELERINIRVSVDQAEIASLKSKTVELIQKEAARERKEAEKKAEEVSE